MESFEIVGSVDIFLKNELHINLRKKWQSLVNIEENSNISVISIQFSVRIDECIKCVFGTWGNSQGKIAEILE